MRAHALLPRVSGRVAVTHLNVAGRMLIGFHLFSRAPGIKGVDVSFLHPPEIDVKFSPFGMTVTEIPGILNALKVCCMAPTLHSCTQRSYLHRRVVSEAHRVLACMLSRTHHYAMIVKLE